MILRNRYYWQLSAVGVIEMSKYIAGIFAVPKYKSEAISNLPFCSNDCKELKKVLCHNLGVEETNLKILGDKPDSNVQKIDLLRQIRVVCRKAEQDDTVILYFSGHGYAVNKEGYLIPYDTEHDLIPDTAISVSRVKDELQKCAARQKFFFIDSCYSGIGDGKNTNIGMTEEFEKSLFLDMPEGLIIFASCKQSELSFSLEDGFMSVFTHYLVEGLRGNAANNGKSEISFNDLNTYVTRNVRNWGLDNNKIQTPNMSSELVGELIFRLKNPEKVKEETHKSDISNLDNNIIQMKLFSNYIAVSSEMEIDDEGIPTGIYIPVQDEVRKARISRYEADFKGKLLATIAKYYKASDIKIAEDGGYSFPFGKLANMSRNVFRNEFVLTINKDLNADLVKNNLLLDLDDQKKIRWDTVEYTFNHVFDFDILQDIVVEKKFEILDFQLEKDYSLIKITTEEKKSYQSRWYISFKNEADRGTMSISSNYSLDNEFFETIPIEDMILTYSKSLKI